jgi:hypothetical protein
MNGRLRVGSIPLCEGASNEQNQRGSGRNECSSGALEPRANESPGNVKMRKPREVLMIAALAGLLIVGVAAFVVQPSLVSTLTAGATQPASGAVLNAADLPLGPSA